MKKINTQDEWIKRATEVLPAAGFGNFENNIKDILHPYFTTKKNGTGLGLSIVNKIINDHNGKIEFIAINNGAKVNITFNLNDS